MKIRVFLLTALLTLLQHSTCTAQNQAASATAPKTNPQLVVSLTSGDTAVSSTANIKITAPAGVPLDKLHVMLNGSDVRSRFNFVPCDTTCLSGTVSATDGGRPGQNALYTYTKTQDGHVLSTRFPFDLAGAASARVRGLRAMAASPAGVAVAADGGSTFVAPTVAFQTLTPGGWKGPGKPWFQIGSQTYPSASTPACSNQFFVVVLNRQTLVEQTSAPESSPHCSSGSADLSSYLATLTPSDLAIVGTISGYNSGNSLDTSAIGGTKYTSGLDGYIAIGAGQTQAGTAYENYVVNSSSITLTPWAFANGTLQQDTNGNYNFQSSDVREYVANPGPTGTTQGVVTVEMSASDKASTGATNDLYNIPSVNGERGGYWMLVLDRTTLTPTALNAGASGGPPLTDIGTGTPASGCTSTISGGARVWTGCGTIYATGDGGSQSTRTQAYQQLASDLQKVTPYHLIFLMSFGYPACCGDYYSVAYQPGYGDFANALEAFGGSPRETMFTTNINNQVYTYITSSGMGDPMMGHSAESSTFNAEASQTGYIHGTMVRSQNGLFQTSQNNQEADAAHDAAAGPDYTLSKVTVQQPVDWPEQSATVLMPGATSIAGQSAAYRWISYTLITDHYIQGAIGPHLDDLHYYFTGSNANYINYHYFDPRQLAFPGQAGQSYTWTDPVTGVTLSPFTQNDFTTVLAQVNSEVVYLVNSLNYLITGPVNLKDSVVSSNSSASAALVGAAANILSSTLQPSPSTPVTANVDNILSAIGGLAGVAAGIASDGSFDLVDSVITNRISKAATLIGGAFSAAGAISGGIRKGGASQNNGSRYQGFASTIGELAQSDLQGEFSTGFDLTVDSILSDWGRLSTIGPLTTDSTNTSFYSPNQIAQAGALTAINLGIQRSYYMSLMPSLYSVHFWPAVAGTDIFDSRNDGQINVPAAGSQDKKGNQYPWYMTGQSAYPSPYSYEWVPSPGQGNGTPGNMYPSTDFQDNCPIHVYVIAAPQTSSSTRGTSKAYMQPISDALGRQLFSSAGLAIPFDEFVGRNGPFRTASQYTWMDMSTMVGYATGFNPNQAVNAQSGYIICYRNLSSQSVSSTEDDSVDTDTVLDAPATAAINKPFTLRATVTQSSGPVTGGSVYFEADGVAAGNMPLDSNGTASLVVTPTVGQHAYQAFYSVVSPYNVSSSPAATVAVYAGAPDLAVSLAQATLQIKYGATSGPIAVQVSSLAEMAGTVQFSCSGLPLNMGCTFDTTSATLAADSSVTTNVKIVDQTTTAQAGMPLRSFLAIGTTLSFLILWLARRRFDLRAGLVALLVIITTAAVGCSSGSTPAAVKNAQEVGTKTILINATCGNVTKSAPLVVTIQ